MNETRTRHVSPDELKLALAPFAKARQVQAGPTRVGQAGEPLTTLGAGPLRTFERVQASEARPSTPPAVTETLVHAPRALTRLRHVDAQLGKRAKRVPRRMHAWQAWMLVFALGGFALGGLLAIATHQTQARLPPPPPPIPEPSMPAGTTSERRLAPRDEAVLADALTVGGSVADRREAVDALLAGRARVALERYQRALATEPQLGDAAAIEHVVVLLSRELRACEQEAGTPCGL